ncbi:MAG: RNA 2',3'-cyclic phosphodiesterase [Sphingomonadales bacterium]
MIRLFVGIELPETVKERLLALGGGVPGARWQTDAQLHLTLRFIGEVDGARCNDIHSALGEIRAKPFVVAIKGVGLFGKLTNPRILWAGIEPDEPVIRLHEKIKKALTGIGLPPEERKYRPHVTLARFRHSGPDRVRAFLEQNDALALPAFEVRNFALFSSFLSHGGAIYRIEERYDL